MNIRYTRNMEPEINNKTVVQEVAEKSGLHIVTPLSKYLAMVLFIILPFVGGWIGYHYAPEKVVEVEKVVVKEIEFDDGDLGDAATQNSGPDETVNTDENIGQDQGNIKEGDSPIKVVFPVNNAEWEIGRTHLIRWEGDTNVSEDGKYHAHLFNELGERKSISVGYWGDNELYYTVSNLVTTPLGTYTLKMCDHPVCDEGAISHGVTIHIVDEGSASSSITVIDPKGDNAWKKGEVATIQWVDSGYVVDESQYSIFVTDKNGTEYGTLTNTIAGTSWPWFDVGTFRDGSQLSELRHGETAYYIKVVDKSNPSNHSLINSPHAAFFVITD